MHFCKKCVCRQEHTAVIADSIVRCKWPRFIISKNRDVNRFELKLGIEKQKVELSSWAQLKEHVKAELLDGLEGSISIDDLVSHLSSRFGALPVAVASTSKPRSIGSASV